MVIDPLLFLDDIIAGERIMAAAGHGLRIRYGLRSDPGATAQAQWASATRSLIQRGMTRDAAGDAAAKQVFPDYRTHVYASEGDTIETLLRLAEEK